MRFQLNEDQATFVTFLEQMLASDDAGFRPGADWNRYDYGHALDARLEENGFFDVAREPELGPLVGALMVHKVAQVPVVVECAASALIRPFLGRDLPRPLAVVTEGARGAIRFLPQARGLVSIGAGRVRYAALPEGAVTSVESLFSYPMGTVDAGALDWVDLDADPKALHARWSVATAAELTGVLKAGLDSVIAYVSDRHQFGRPLGSFQTVQHRLATGSVEIEGATLQMLRAAQSLAPEEADCALGYAQGIARRIGYDLHQFMGAMGLTLEHPLHRWTYRARLLRTDMGGAAAAYLRYADARWCAA